MQELTINPALSMREGLDALHPRGLFRWDASGRALLVSDAPRHGAVGERFLMHVQKKRLRTQTARGLLYIDLPPEPYAELLRLSFDRWGALTDAWFGVQSLLGSLLAHGPGAGAGEHPDEPLLRAAMLACAQGERHVRAFIKALRTADAQALRVGKTASVRAAAALVARWLWNEKGIAPAKPVHWNG